MPKAIGCSHFDIKPAIAEVNNKMFTHKLLALLSMNKRYPKYQHERRIDIFLQFFLSDIFEARFGEKVVCVIPEFPLKRDEDSLTTNMDYLVYCEPSNTVYICEFKTDFHAFREKQAARYLKAMNTPWRSIVADIEQISTDSALGHRTKWNDLLMAAREIPNDVSIKVLYIAPEKTRCRLKRYIETSHFELLPLEELTTLFIETPFLDEWLLVRDSLLGKTIV